MLKNSSQELVKSWTPTQKHNLSISEKLDDGTLRYIVRIGIHKFIMNVKKDDMEFVMDLC